jgi:beta-N-acetylhexosaminidase
MRVRVWRLAAATVVAVAAVAIGLSETLEEGGEPADTGPDAGDLSLRGLAGERLVAGFFGGEPPGELRRMIAGGELAGVVLFAENFDSHAEARRLVRSLQSIGRPRELRDPLLVMVDQEGGAIRRLPGPPLDSAAQMGARGATYSRRQARATARNLRGAGFNVDLAPVLDVGRAGGAIDTEQRSFGSTPAGVEDSGVAFAEGLEAGGAAATGKHFPGLGAAQINTDFGVERIELSKSTIRGLDEAPFQSFVEAGGKFVMMSNAIYPAFSERPAVFSEALATGELRKRLGFDGVSISDALNAAAAEAFGGPAKAARAAAAAGTDLLLFRNYKSAIRAGAALRAALRSRALPRAQFERSAQRVLDLRADLGS